jgi:SAM-dependent methyltransferase
VKPLAAWVPARSSGPELIDLPIAADAVAEYAGSLADIRTVNRYLGDYRAVLGHLPALLPAVAQRRGRPLRVLDVATGSADIPVAMALWARGRGIPLEVTAVDNNPLAVREAEAFTRGCPEITVARGDCLSLPYGDGSFDVVVCAKSLHHFSDEDAVRVLREILRVTAGGYLVIDLRRSRVAWALISLLSRLFTRNRLTRHDGPLSVLRSYTVAELDALAARAGLCGRRVTRAPFWLIVVAGRKG